MAKKQSITTPAVEETQKPGSLAAIPVEVQDACMHAHDIAEGIDNLLSAAACSDNGISPEACKALDIAAEQLVAFMTTVNSFVNPVD